MKKFPLVIASFCLLTTACGQTSTTTSKVAGSDTATQGTLLTCASIDPTFSPYYEVKVRAFDVTFPDSYIINIAETETDGFPGPITVQHQKESHGSELIDGVGKLVFTDGALDIKQLENGELKGNMKLGELDNIELTCQLFADIQPVAGVSN